MRVVDAPTTAPDSATAAAVTVDARGRGGAPLPSTLFGVGVDLQTGSYIRPGDRQCVALAGVRSGDGVALVRIGAEKADNYDWRADTYYDPQDPRRHSNASQGCSTHGGTQAASILRVLGRARDLGAHAVVVLNGETDDPQGAYNLVRLVARRLGYPFARAVYWEIGNAPENWQHFGVPLAERRGDEHMLCQPDQYAALVTGYAAAISAALRVTAKSSPRIVADAWITNATDQSWTGKVTAVDTPYYPYAATEPANPEAIASSVVSPTTGAVPLDDQLSGLRAGLSQYSDSGAVRLFVGQWNVVDTSSSLSGGPDLYASYGQAVFVASLLTRLAHDGVTMAAWSQPLYGSAQAPFGDGQGGTSPGYAVLTALGQSGGAHVLPASMPLAAGIDGLALRRADGGITIALVRAGAGGRGPASILLRLLGGPKHAVQATVRTFSATSPGDTTTLTVDPAGARLAVPAPGVMILTLPAR